MGEVAGEEEADSPVSREPVAELQPRTPGYNLSRKQTLTNRDTQVICITSLVIP